MTPMPASPFISNPSVIQPPTEGPAAALPRTSVPDAQTGAAADLSSFARRSSKLSAIQGESDPSVTLASAPGETEAAACPSAAASDKIAEPSMTNGGDPGAPASAPTKNPDAGALADRIDWHAFFDAVMDERIILFELTNDVPLFIRDGDHLRRWSA